MTTATAETTAPPSYLESGQKGLLGWIFSTDHKRIAVLYLVTMVAMFLIAVVVGIFMRLEQMSMGETMMKAQTYNALFTLHGVIMVFLFVVPGLPAVFGNFFLPLLIGAKDVSFPRINLLSWYCFVVGAGLAVLSLFTGGGPADTGWTFYVPFSTRTGTNVTMATAGAFVIGFSSILTGINFITTIHRLRAPGMTWFKMPLFPWSLYATGWVQVIATPIIGITLFLLILDRLFGMGYFDPARGGDPITFQHLFWTYSHPAVYIMILPAMGVISEIFPTFAHRSIFGYKAIAFSSLAIAGLGSLVWGHHMFTSGMAETANIIFSLLTFLVAVPSAIKVFNWTATLYQGSIELRAPLLYALTFVFLFSIGGLTGLMNGALALNQHIHDTYFIVGHFHYVMFGGTGVGFFAALLYWFPKMTGKMYNERVAVLSWVPFFVGFNMLYFTMLVLGYQGMPRRYYDHLPQYHAGHLVASVGAYIMAAGIFLFFGNLVAAMLKGKPAPADPWGGKTLEWRLPSPPPTENFETIPVVREGPYAYNPETKEA